MIVQIQGTKRGCIIKGNPNVSISHRWNNEKFGKRGQITVVVKIILIMCLPNIIVLLQTC